MTLFNERAGLTETSNNPFYNTEIVWGEISLLKPGLVCNVRTFKGEDLYDVLLPGGDTSLKGKGRFGPYRRGQRVLVGFPHGNTSNAAVMQWYPHAGSTAAFNSKDIDNFVATNPEIDTPGDTQDFIDVHPSGYKVHYTTGMIRINNGATDVMTIIMAPGGINVKIGTGTVSVPNGEALQTWMNNIVTAITAVWEALKNSPTTAADGGAAYKAAIAIVVNANPPPTVPGNLNTTNTKQSSI